MVQTLEPGDHCRELTLESIYSNDVHTNINGSSIKDVFFFFLSCLHLFVCVESQSWSVGFSLVATCGFQSMRTQQLQHMGLEALWHVGHLFPNEGWNYVPCFGGQILNHWTTREIPQRCVQFINISTVSDDTCTVR